MSFNHETCKCGAQHPISCNCNTHNNLSHHSHNNHQFCSCGQRHNHLTSRQNHSVISDTTERHRNNSWDNIQHTSRQSRSNRNANTRMRPLSKRREPSHHPLPSLCPKEKLISDVTGNSVNFKSKDNDPGSKNIVIIF